MRHLQPMFYIEHMRRHLWAELGSHIDVALSAVSLGETNATFSENIEGENKLD